MTRHVLFTNPDAFGFEYGMLRDFEDAIVRATGASRVPLPAWGGPRVVRDRIAHGTRWAKLRSWVPKTSGFALDADVLWLVVMGPESSPLDLLRGWDRRVGYKILYVMDTLPHQIEALRALTRATRWDLAITSFPEAVPWLERETGVPWRAVPQGISKERFVPRPPEERSIAVASYGRRLPVVHRAIDAWALARGLHYEVSIASSVDRSLDVRYLYRHYAFHLTRSVFAVSWPVEVTHPGRAGGQSPLTCRWFEAAAAGAVMIGAPPKDPAFEALFGPGAVAPLDPRPASEREVFAALDALWERRLDLLARANERREARIEQWTWDARVREMMAMTPFGNNVRG